jgi:hypothetical protein
MAGCHRERCGLWSNGPVFTRTSYAPTGHGREHTTGSPRSILSRSIRAMVAVTHVEPLEGYTLRLCFDDGSERVVDLSDVLWARWANRSAKPTTSDAFASILSCGRSSGPTGSIWTPMFSTATMSPRRQSIRLRRPHPHKPSRPRTAQRHWLAGQTWIATTPGETWTRGEASHCGRTDGQRGHAVSWLDLSDTSRGATCDQRPPGCCFWVQSATWGSEPQKDDVRQADDGQRDRAAIGLAV